MPHKIQLFEDNNQNSKMNKFGNNSSNKCFQIFVQMELKGLTDNNFAYEIAAKPHIHKCFMFRERTRKYYKFK